MRLTIWAAVVLLAAACGDDDAPSDTMGGADAGAAGPSCERGVIESDLLGVTGAPAALAGDGIDPESGALLPTESGSYLVSSTYLALQADAGPRFGELVGPIVGDLQRSPGLLAVSLGTSESCGTARTLTVWESREAMMGFVASPSHLAAVAAVGEVSRGGSIVTSWDTTQGNAVGWAMAATELAADDGPFY